MPTDPRGVPTPNKSGIVEDFEEQLWENRFIPKTPEDFEREHVLKQIGAIREAAKTLDDLIPAFDLQREWLEKHPKDIAMLRVGSRLIRSVEWRGGNWDDFSARLLQCYAEQLKAA